MTGNRLTTLTRTLERGVRSGILLVFALGLRRRNPAVLVNAAVAYLGSFVPDVVERRYGVGLRPWQRVYAATAMLTHAVGMLGPYDDVWWWDHLTHTHSATLIGGVVYLDARSRGRSPGPRVVAAVACAGVLWELLEYAIHTVADYFGFDPILVAYSERDTALDLVFDLLGALLVVVFGGRLIDRP